MTQTDDKGQTGDKRLSSPQPVQPAGPVDWLYDPKLRGIASQIIVFVLLLWGLYEIVVNTQTNLKRVNQNFGFDFLTQSAGFDILSSLISYSSSSSYGRAIMVGFWNTVLVAGLGIFFTTILGFIVGVMRLSRNAVVSGAATIYVEALRNVPLLLQIFMWYALVLKPLPGPKQAFNIADSVFISNRGVLMPMPQFGEGAGLALWFLAAAIAASIILVQYARRTQEQTGRRIPAGWISAAMIVLAPVTALLIRGWPLTWDYPALAGFNFKGGMTMIPELIALLVALVLYTAAFIAENVRSGIQAVNRGQTEASLALGLSQGQALRLVIIPQAMRVIIPPLASQYLNLTKNSSLAIAIGYPDLVAVGGTVLNQSGKAIEIVAIWMGFYLALSLLTSGFMNWFNSRIKLVER